MILLEGQLPKGAAYLDDADVEKSHETTTINSNEISKPINLIFIILI